ncbi:PA14 domain-containing protein [Pontibacter fetidus]|uniref:T9SS type A sorting domain-containing protein n=1 Tax=Pontibacter fetidus TaxID=2700082 RepID=A0A6B2H0L7_9BACT|nr:PA14 domain-containing protein [Pontibacter fetidus]NDK55861.1 T9SS type A sorting domain-containing protein [Pontibacter fetidus]
MNTQTSYVNKKAQLLLAVLLTVLVSVFIPNLVQAQTYSGPLVITKGGTYTGNWESRDSEIPAVDVRTSEPVVIVNSNIRGAGYLIKSWGHGVNITVRHTNGYGLTPTAWRDYPKSRRFLSIDVFRNVVVENCYMEGTAGIFVGEQYVGNGTTSESIKIRYNKAKNIDGRVQGDTDLVQFVQFNFRGDVRGAEIGWNQVINEPGKSAVEDNINLFNSRGTSDSPIRIHNNYIEGAYPNPATGNEYSGGGIISDTNAGLDQATRYVEAHDNHLVNLGNYSMGIAGGNNIRYHHNRAINSATFKDGTRFNMYTSGLWSADYYKMGTTFSNSIDNNVVGITAWGWDNNRNDFTVNQYASYSNNTNLSGTITLQTEAAEFELWQQKLAKNGIVLGPNGSGASTSPIATAPAPAPAPAPPTETSTGTTTSGGKITREFWSNITTGSVASIPTTNPTSKSELTLFEAPQNVGHDYGQRVKGYVTAPTTGNYTFWISSDDNSELYLSTSEDPSKKVKIASINGWTNSREYTKFASQKSATIALEAGKRYYIEAAMVDIDGGDHLSVGWQLPNGTQERPIAGNRLSPMGSTAPTTTSPTPTVNQAPAITLTSPKTGTSYTAGTAITLSATATDADGKIAKVEFFQGSTKIGESTVSPYNYNWANAAAGSYSITAKATDNSGATKTSTAATITVTALTSTAPSTGTTTGSTTGTGKITREFWSNITTGSVASIPTTNPTSKSELTLFEAPQNVGHDYGQRVKGYVTAPATGNYTFWISSDDNSELYLSTSEDPAKKVKIASITGWTNSREYTKFASQKSATIALEAGKRYYIEAAMVDIDGGDHLSVGWQLPNGTQERPIAGNRLSPMGSVATTTTTPTTEPVATVPGTTTTVTGKITRQFWSNVTGTSVAAVPTSNPTSTSELTLFEAPQNVGDDYGQRIKGYVTAPSSGNYTFWIASDDYSELYLSTSEDPAKKVKIASVTGWTNSREYTKFASQKSATIALEAGKRYYIEAVMMDVYGGDHLSVGWQLPNGTQERPIAGNRLSPIGSTTDAGSITLASASTTTETADTDISFTDVTAYPNPFKTVLTLDMGSQNVKLQSVVIMTQDGKVKYKEDNLQLVNNKLEMDLTGARLKRGIYLLKYTDSNGNSKSLKVIKE